MLCAILVPSDVIPKKDLGKLLGRQSASYLTNNAFWNIVKEEGATCILDARRRSQIRIILNRHIRQSCGGYTKVAENIVQDIFAVSLALKEKGEVKEARMEVLKMALHMCQVYKLKNTKLIQQLIIELFTISGTMVDWFEFLNPFGNLNRLRHSSLYPYPHERRGLIRHWTTKKHLQALEYFLQHGNQLDLYVSTHPRLMQVNGQPIYAPVCFADFPLENYLFGNMTPLGLACLVAHPQAVLLLLRYGASALHPHHTVTSPHENWCQPLYILVNQMNLRDSDDFATGMASTAEGQRTVRQISACRTQRLIQCLDYLSRSTPSLPMKITNEASLSSHSIIALRERFADNLPSRCSDRPSELQHLCRCRIRRVLQESRRLPHALQELPLPQIIRDYLDLKRDF